jgi:UDP-GlcNAc:undecaprenyl-phosphate/decaprenyl-phosphate GlcNAc-1-phosphate transferase
MSGGIILTMGFITAFFVVLLATPSLIKVAKLKHLVDEPTEERKLHRTSTPTIGGIIIFGAILFAYALWFPDNYGHIEKAFTNFKFLVASLILLFFVGVKDDVIGTAPMKKLVSHIIVAFILVIMAEIRIKSMHGLFGIYELQDWQSISLSVFTYVVIVNAINLIDGIDGLASGVVFIAASLMGTWFYMSLNVPLALLAFVLAGALAGFLVFNFSPARIFMGDSGSLTIGAIVSVLAISLVNQDTSNVPDVFGKVSMPIFVMAVLSYPLIDTLRVFIYRAIKGVSPFSADKNHIHHKLLSMGFNHAKAVALIYVYTIVVTAIVVFAALDSVTWSFVVALISAAAIAAIPFILKPKSIRD